MEWRINVWNFMKEDGVKRANWSNFRNVWSLWDWLKAKETACKYYTLVDSHSITD